MNGIKLVIDTNIALYLLNGDTTVQEILDGNFLSISTITEMELRAFPSISEIEMESIKSFCDAVDIVGLSLPIKETAIEIRRTKNLKLPDAIIAATAIHLDTPFLTADRTFERVENLNLMLYQPGILP